MKAKVSNEIIVFDPTKNFVEKVRKNLTVANPDFVRLQKMGKWVGNTPKEIQFFRMEGKNIVLPFGCLYTYIFADRIEATADFPKVDDVEYGKKVSLYDYQQEAVYKALSYRQGILVAPCGSGKTQMGLAIASLVSRPTLWITHTKDLMLQAEERAKSIFDLPKEAWGEITEGKVKLGTHITFSTVQTLARVNLSNLKFGCVIVDECHHAVQSYKATSMFAKVMNQISCRYKYGLTATPFRADGLEKGMFALIGGICAEVPKSAVEDKTVPISECWYDTNYAPSWEAFNGDGTLDYTKMITDICESKSRNKVIADVICKIDGSCIVLSDRLAQLESLMEIVGDKKKCEMIRATASKKGKEARRESIRKLQTGEIDCLFATYKLAKEGLDIPSLENVVMASPTKDKSTVIQSAGRVTRKSEGKAVGYVHDFIDPFPPLARMAIKREKIRKDLK